MADARRRCELDVLYPPIPHLYEDLHEVPTNRISDSAVSIGILYDPNISGVHEVLHHLLTVAGLLSHERVYSRPQDIIFSLTFMRPSSSFIPLFGNLGNGDDALVRSKEVHGPVPSGAVYQRNHISIASLWPEIDPQKFCKPQLRKGSANHSCEGVLSPIPEMEQKINIRVFDIYMQKYLRAHGYG